MKKIVFIGLVGSLLTSNLFGNNLSNIINKSELSYLYQKGCYIWKNSIPYNEIYDISILMDIIHNNNNFKEEDLYNDKIIDFVSIINKNKKDFITKMGLYYYPFNNLNKKDKLALNVFLSRSLKSFLTDSYKKFKSSIDFCRLK